MSSSQSSLSIREKIDNLENLTRVELTQQWETVFKHPPPKAVKRGLLERGVAFHIQERQLGGLKPETRRILLAISTGDKSDVSAKNCSSLRPSNPVPVWFVSGTVNHIRWTSRKPVLNGMARSILLCQRLPKQLPVPNGLDQGSSGCEYLPSPSLCHLHP